MVAQIRKPAVQRKPKQFAVDGIPEDIVKNRQVFQVVEEVLVFVETETKKDGDV